MPRYLSLLIILIKIKVLSLFFVSSFVDKETLKIEEYYKTEIANIDKSFTYSKRFDSKTSTFNIDKLYNTGDINALKTFLKFQTIVPKVYKEELELMDEHVQKTILKNYVLEILHVNYVNIRSTEVAYKTIILQAESQGKDSMNIQFLPISYPLKTSKSFQLFYKEIPVKSFPFKSINGIKGIRYQRKNPITGETQNYKV